MPLRLGDLYARDVPLTIDVDGEQLNVTYRPSVITGEFIQQFERGTFAEGYDLLARALVSWDLLGDDNEPLPITEETLAKLPLDAVVLLYRAMIRGARPDPQRAASSNTGSRRGA